MCHFKPHLPVISVALDLLLALYLFSHVHQPVGLLLVLAVAWTLFFLPLAFHRIPHDAGWQNPTSMMGLVIGFSYTSLCYIVKIMPNILYRRGVVVVVVVVVVYWHYIPIFIGPYQGSGQRGGGAPFSVAKYL